MDGQPVTIRLIDPPLHEFLPAHDTLLREVTELETRQELHDRDHALRGHDRWRRSASCSGRWSGSGR